MYNLLCHLGYTRSTIWVDAIVGHMTQYQPLPISSSFASHLDHYHHRLVHNSNIHHYSRYHSAWNNHSHFYHSDPSSRYVRIHSLWTYRHYSTSQHRHPFNPLLYINARSNSYLLFYCLGSMGPDTRLYESEVMPFAPRPDDNIHSIANTNSIVASAPELTLLVLVNT